MKILAMRPLDRPPPLPPPVPFGRLGPPPLPALLKSRARYTILVLISVIALLVLYAGSEDAPPGAADPWIVAAQTEILAEERAQRQALITKRYLSVAIVVAFTTLGSTACAQHNDALTKGPRRPPSPSLASSQ
jgi:hypothetical protein